MAYEWVILDNRNEVFRCGHCGAEEKLKLPLTPRAFEYQGHRFMETHKLCKEVTKDGVKMLFKDLWRSFKHWFIRTPKNILVRKKH